MLCSGNCKKSNSRNCWRFAPYPKHLLHVSVVGSRLECLQRCVRPYMPPSAKGSVSASSMLMLVHVSRRRSLYSRCRSPLPLATCLVKFAAVVVLREQLHSSILLVRLVGLCCFHHPLVTSPWIVTPGQFPLSPDPYQHPSVSTSLV